MERIVKIQIPKGYYMSWFVTTQAANKVTVTLKDDKKTYFSSFKQSTYIDPPLAIGADFIAGDNLTAIIDIAQAEHIYGTPHLNDILTEEGISVGKEFVLCLEDSMDKDYNDVAISIIAWKGVG